MISHLLRFILLPLLPVVIHAQTGGDEPPNILFILVDVTTLEGDPMGDWIQYAFGPTVSAWLRHHYYLHWRYSMDKEFLKNEAYNFINQRWE